MFCIKIWGNVNFFFTIWFSEPEPGKNGSASQPWFVFLSINLSNDNNRHHFQFWFSYVLVPGEPLLLAHAPMNGDGGEVLLDQQLGHGDTALHRLHEDHHLGENVAIQYVHIKRGKTVHMKLESIF